MFLFFIFCPLFAHMAYCLPHSSSTFRSWMRARIWLRAAFVPKLRLGRVAICKLEPALNVILAKSHKGVPAKPLPMCNMCYIKIYHKNNFITLYTGWFFNGYPPENVSRLVTPEVCLNWHPPKFSKCWNQIHFARHWGVFRSWGVPVWVSNVFFLISYLPAKCQHLANSGGCQLKNLKDP